MVVQRLIPRIYSCVFILNARCVYATKWVSECVNALSLVCLHYFIYFLKFNPKMLSALHQQIVDYLFSFVCCWFGWQPHWRFFSLHSPMGCSPSVHTHTEHKFILCCIASAVRVCLTLSPPEHTLAAAESHTLNLLHEIPSFYMPQYLHCFVLSPPVNGILRKIYMF